MEDKDASPQHLGEDALSSSPSFPYFCHNTTTIPSNLPPRIDDRPTARQKRKRTSPEDHAVLEAYYACDAKPDKAARLDLVKRVALGEKEVQIWFQNRRQSSRRKSRPLLPHEIAQYQLSKSIVTPDLSASELDPSLTQSRPQSWHHDSTNPPLHLLAAYDTGTLETPVEQAHMVERSTSPQAPHSPHLSGNDRIVPTDRLGTKNASQSPEHIPSSWVPSAHSGPSINITNRGCVPNLFSGQPQRAGIETHGHPHRGKSPRRVKKASSFVRLSMTSDGGAQVIAKDSTSPSPPRPAASAHTFCGRDKPSTRTPLSDATIKPVSDVSSTPALHRAPSGRSRDSRAWEFWCDKECRTELEDKAEKDQSGSASDAIQLLRSASGRSVLGPLPAKRISLQPNASKRLRREARMPLQRSSTSNGRLQGKKVVESISKVLPKMIGSKSALLVQITGNSSDKENWSPTSDLQSESAVGEQDVIEPAGAPTELGSQSAKHFRLQSRHRESIDPENDSEIAAFMRAGRDSDKLSDHEELDCVQGLLSLSQGNWR